MTASTRNNTTWQQFYKPHVLQSNSQGLRIGNYCMQQSSNHLQDYFVQV